MPASVESLVVMPDARSTFSLTKENSARLKEEILEMFGGKELHEYRYITEERDWRYSKINPVMVKRIDVAQHGTDAAAGVSDKSLLLLFEASECKFPFMELSNEPKVAFLESIISVADEPAGICGLYLSSGRYPVNPWVGRDERIYVARTHFNEQLLR